MMGREERAGPPDTMPFHVVRDSHSTAQPLQMTSAHRVASPVYAAGPKRISSPSCFPRVRRRIKTKQAEQQALDPQSAIWTKGSGKLDERGKEKRGDRQNILYAVIRISPAVFARFSPLSLNPQPTDLAVAKGRFGGRQLKD